MDLKLGGEIMQALNGHNGSIETASDLANRRRSILRYTRAATVKNDQRRAYYWALLHEIRMLVDYIAANPAHTLGEIHIKDPRSPTEEISIDVILSRLDEIDSELEHPSETSGERSLKPEDTAFLQIIRDTLNRIARPASSLTIAYTALVTGSRRSKDTESREKLARKAYGGMISIAHWHRVTQWTLLAVALFITLLAVRESSNVALGRDYMRNLASLQAQQASIAAEKTRLDGMLPPPALLPTENERLASPKDADSNKPVVSVFDLCARADALANYFTRQTIELPLRAQVHDVCGRDFVLQTNLGIVRQQLKEYERDWWEMAGLPAVIKLGRNPLTGLGKGQDDVEFITGPMLTMWGNYMLPVIFGLLGILVFVILDFYGKIRDSRLDPRDHWLCLIRLVLGLVTGSCIGLFYSATVPANASPTESVAAALSLSASGIAFLAGYGVESVFNMLEGLVNRVFVAQQPQR
jgi:hypothetical protein